ncbi:hypothetical protein [Falsibacillus pallidus]|uniref:Uncharacterized protein n=1 Tax=Falsibacillus pallidus TaxID=493781 RepID=A0A370G8A5_9BACI|nr:hypothetical protein [Falsibacillus pallidus]RDI39997.1 hypothetical protein DFR59_11320 [Falsibacillus pallidus]
MGRFLTPEEAYLLKKKRRTVRYVLIGIATIGLGAGVSVLPYLM